MVVPDLEGCGPLAAGPCETGSRAVPQELGFFVRARIVIAAIKDLNGTWASGPSAPRWAIVALPARNKVWRPTLGLIGVPRLRGTAALQVRNDHEEL